jgi:LPXTG-site transpeptidase (sortase) family protein
MDRGSPNHLLFRVRAGFSELRSRNLVPTILIVIGALMVLYVASQYGEMYLEQKRLANAWEQEQALRSDSPTTQQAHAMKDNGMVRLVIPKIDLTSFIVEGTNHKSLLLGPGHMTKTAEPGEIGNAVITGHRDTFFRNVYQLEKGDQVFVERGGKRFVYQVTGKKIVDPDDMSVTRPTSDAEVTLITCYPTYFIGPAPKRLVLFTKLANEQNAPLTASDDDKGKPGPHTETAGTSAGH